ncbi:MAG: T9SS type A sorting domain-containing protein, partial [Bacteroidota bacterium]
VPYGQNAYVLSEPLIVNSIAQFCNLTGLSRLEQDQQIQFYPNPASNKLTVAYSNANNIALPKVFDISGKELKVPIFTDTNNAQLQLDVSALSKGLYFISINAQMAKFLKE